MVGLDCSPLLSGLVLLIGLKIALVAGEAVASLLLLMSSVRSLFGIIFTLGTAPPCGGGGIKGLFNSFNKASSCIGSAAW